jgi:hypothetical protein
LSDSKTNAFGFSFTDEVRMRQFGLAVLLSAGRQLNWYCAGSYKVLQDNLAGDRLLTGYSDFDCVFIVHNRGTMKNGIMGQTINQISILRAPKKTFFFDLGGPTIPDLIFQVRPVSGGSVGGRGFDV